MFAHIALLSPFLSACSSPYVRSLSTLLLSSLLCLICSCNISCGPLSPCRRHCSPVHFFFSVFTAHHWASLSVCLPNLHPKFQLFIYNQLVRYCTALNTSSPAHPSCPSIPMQNACVHLLALVLGKLVGEYAE